MKIGSSRKTACLVMRSWDGPNLVLLCARWHRNGRPHLQIRLLGFKSVPRLAASRLAKESMDRKVTAACDCNLSLDLLLHSSLDSEEAWLLQAHIFREAVARPGPFPFVPDKSGGTTTSARPISVEVVGSFFFALGGGEAKRRRNPS